MNGQAIGYAIGGLIAAEAVGLTDFSGGSTESRVSAPSSPLPQTPVMAPPETGSGPSLADMQALLSARDRGREIQASVDRATQSVPQQVPQPPTVISTGGQGPSTDEIRRIIEDTVDTASDKAGEAAGTSDSGPGVPEWWSDPDEWRDRLNLDLGDGSGGGDETPRPTDDGSRGSQPDRSDIVSNITDPEPGAQTGDFLAAGFETVGGAEDVVGGGIETLQRTGTTLAETVKASAGEEYTTSGTFAEGPSGGERRRIYEGSLSGIATEQVGENVRNTAEGMQEAVNKAFEGFL